MERFSVLRSFIGNVETQHRKDVGILKTMCMTRNKSCPGLWAISYAIDKHPGINQSKNNWASSLWLIQRFLQDRGVMPGAEPLNHLKISTICLLLMQRHKGLCCLAPVSGCLCCMSLRRTTEQLSEKKQRKTAGFLETVLGRGLSTVVLL